MEPLEKTIQELGDGEVKTLPTGEKIFILSSHPQNPILDPRQLGLTWTENGEKRIGAAFNGGATLHEGFVILTPRIHRNYRRVKFYDEKLGTWRWGMENYISEVWPLKSVDGVNFTRIDNVSIKGDGTQHRDFIYGIEDIRIIPFRKQYLLVGCGKIKPPFKGANADRIAIYSTRNFKEITYHGMVAEFDSRNSFPFPEEINGKIYMLIRFHPNIHLDVLEAGIDQLLNPKKYSELWKKIYERREKTILIKAGEHLHEREKIGAGPPPIKVPEGWLLIYHSVGKINKKLASAYGLKHELERCYTVSAALLDRTNPRKVLARTPLPIYVPSKPWELEGNEQYPVDIPYVVFPTGAIKVDDKLLIYAGAGDKYMVLLGCNLGTLLDYLREEGKMEQ